jgi:hypothetical protein
MLKKIALVIALLVVLLSSAAWYALSNANALIARFKPQIETAASKALGAPVSFGHLDTSILPSTQILIDAVSIGGPEGLSLKDIALHLNVWALLGRRLEITELRITEPALTFIKDATGVHLVGLPRKEKPAALPPSPVATEKTPVTNAPSTLDIALETFSLRNATIIFRDSLAKTEERMSALDITAGLDIAGSTVKLPSLTASALVRNGLKVSAICRDLTFDQSSGVVSAPNLALDLAGFPLTIAARFDTRAASGDVAIRSTGIDLAKLSALGALIPPTVTTLNLRGLVAPNLTAVLAPGKVSAKGTVKVTDVALNHGGFAVTKLGGDIALASEPNEQSIESKNLTLSVNGEQISGGFAATTQGTTTRLKNIGLTIFGGRLDSSGSFDAQSHAVSANLQLSDIEIGRALGFLKPGAPAPLSGKLTRFETKFTATAGPTLTQTLSGSGSLGLKDGKLAGENIGGKVLKAATNLPFISGALYDATPPETRKALDAQETVISALTTSFTLGGGALTTKDLALKSPLFDIAAAGRVGFNGALDLKATLIFDKGLSGAIATKAKEVRAALDKDGRLPVPLAIKGTAPNLSVMPDFAKLLTGNVGKVIEQKAGDALNKLLQGKKGGGTGKGLGGILGF